MQVSGEDWVLVDRGSGSSLSDDLTSSAGASTSAGTGAEPAGPSPSSTRVLLLGSAQDAGVRPSSKNATGARFVFYLLSRKWVNVAAQVPQCGCNCPHCRGVLEGELPPKYTVSLAVLHGNQAWLVDATPDIKWQLHLLRKAAPDCVLRGIFLTHLHMGHYTGLLHLAKASCAVRMG